jgi:transcriptional regulator CtsR
VTYKRGFASAQIAVQSNASVQVGACQCGSQLRGKRGGGGFIRPNKSFYNHSITQAN